MATTAEVAKAMAKIQQITELHISNILLSTAKDLVNDAAINKGYSGFTGNTQTSYTAGLFKDKNLVQLVIQDRYKRDPVRLKVEKGKTVYLENPYEGRPRKVKGMVKVDNKYGAQTAEDFLKAFHRNIPKKGYAIVVTTGTEYSKYIEAKKNLNVLTATYQNAKEIVNRHIKTI